MKIFKDFTKSQSKKNKKETRVTFRTQLASQITLIHNDPFPVANMSHWVAKDLTYILRLNTNYKSP